MIAMTLIAYLPAFKAGWIWDDTVITENLLLSSAHGLRQIWTEPSLNINEAHYWPLVYSGFWFERRIWGANPAGYHAVNVLLHAINSLLIWGALKQLGVKGSWTISALFALHPIHAESVAWVIGRKDLQSSAFFLAAFLAYLRFERNRQWHLYALAMASFVAAMLSKSAAVGFPVAAGLAIWHRGEKRYAKYTPLIPLALVAAGMGFFDADYASRHEGFDLAPLSLPDRASLLGRAIWFYVSMLIWPANLTSVYPKWRLSENIGAGFLLLVACGTAVGAILWVSLKRNSPGIAAFVMFFIVALAPTLGFVNFGYMKFSFVADRFAYLGSIGLVAMAGLGARKMMDRLEAQSSFHSTVLGRVGLATIFLILGGLTWSQSASYANPETFWRRNLAKNSGSWLAEYNLGAILGSTGRTDEAAAHLRKSLDLYPGFADAHNALGLSLRRKGDIAGAVGQFGQAMTLDPRLPEPHLNLAETFQALGQFDGAVAQYEIALELAPDNEAARVALADCKKALERRIP